MEQWLSTVVAQQILTLTWHGETYAGDEESVDTSTANTSKNMEDKERDIKHLFQPQLSHNLATTWQGQR